jgi:hypothetical protein
MELNDITNLPSRSSRTTSIHVRVLKEFAPSRLNSLDDSESKSRHRAAGHTNVDLWVDGCLYPNDPAVQFHPTFHNLSSFLQYVGRGEQGLLGYCKRLSMNDSHRLQCLTQQYQALFSHQYHLQQRLLESEKEVQVLKNAIEEKDAKTSKLEVSIAQMKETPLGARERKRGLSSIETLAPKGGARKRRVMATR